MFVLSKRTFIFVLSKITVLPIDFLLQSVPPYGGRVWVMVDHLAQVFFVFYY